MGVCVRQRERERKQDLLEEGKDTTKRLLKHALAGTLMTLSTELALHGS